MTAQAGVRELKARLSAYLALVKRGATVSVTERGLPVARLGPAAGRRRVDPGLAALVAEGTLSGVGGKPVGSRLRGTAPRRAWLSRAVIEDRR